MLKLVLEYLLKRCYSIFRIRDDMEVSNMDTKNLSIFDIANFFRSKEKMTHKKLQKLSYYAYAWYIALYNEEKDKINNRICNKVVFEAWVHGPVCKSLYDKYSDNYGQVDKYNGKLSELISGETKKFLETIYKVFGKYTGDELEVMTHHEYPWQNARNTLPPSAPSNEPILESDMFDYYNSL